MLGVIVLAAMLSVPKGERDAYYDKPPQNTLRDCRSEPEPYGECRLPPGLSAADAEARLAGKDTAWWREGDEFFVVARRDTDQAFLCCAARGRMDHIDGDLWAMRLRIVDLDHATIDVSVRPGSPKVWDVYRGPAAPPAPEMTDFLRLQGRVRLLNIVSKSLDYPRDIAIYTPPGYDPSKTYPVVYMADGDLREDTPRAVEPLILSGRLPPLILVEIWSAHYDPHIRNEEYLEGWPNGGGYFLKHENFVLNEVMPFVEANYSVSRDPKLRAVSGISSSASWAISMGQRHPDIFANVIAESLVWRLVEPELDHKSSTRFFLTAGTLEPEFYKETVKFAGLARADGYDVTLQTTVSGHSLTIFTPYLLTGLEWAFGSGKKQ
ncbi:MAG TPA: alpha/beta hydrolase-fold protein [Rhizomicrobium sp.]|jgi:enterochelin esterase-like enzyme